eukprot:3449071-Heterocapsa_arctica.AAC.1
MRGQCVEVLAKVLLTELAGVLPPGQTMSLETALLVLVQSGCVGSRQRLALGLDHAHVLVVEGDHL